MGISSVKTTDMRLLLSPDADEGGMPSENTTDGVTNQAAMAAAASQPAPPPAADIVLNGEITEEVVNLRETVKQREMRISQLEDENRTLKQVTPRQSARDDRSELEKFMEGEA